jgi:hypothetical protein
MRTVIISILVLVTVISLKAQSLSGLFKNDLSPEVLNYYSSETLDDMFTRDAELNTEMIYWRIFYLNESVGKKNTDFKSNGYNYLTNLASDNYRIRNDFFKKQILIAQKDFVNEYQGRIISALESAFQNPMLINPREYNAPYIDTNKINYFVVKYFLSDPLLQYDKDKNYTLLRGDCEKDLLQNLNTMITNLKDKDKSIVPGFINRFIQNWQIINNYNKSIESLPAVFTKYYESDYSSSDMKKYSAAVGYSFLIFFNPKFVIRAQDFNLKDIPVSNINLALNSFSIGYNYLLRKTISAFSYINLGLIGIFGSSVTHTGDNQYLYTRFGSSMTASNNYTSEYLSAYNISAGNTKYYGAYAKGTTPILVLTQDFLIEIGAAIGVNAIKTDIKYSYDYAKVYVPPSGPSVGLGHGTNIKVNESKTKTSFYISPLIDVHYSLIGPVIIKLNAGYNFAGLMAGVSF